MPRRSKQAGVDERADSSSGEGDATTKRIDDRCTAAASATNSQTMRAETRRDETRRRREQQAGRQQQQARDERRSSDDDGDGAAEGGAGAGEGHTQRSELRQRRFMVASDSSSMQQQHGMQCNRLLVALTLGVHRPQLAHRTGLTDPRPLRFLPPLRRFFVMLAGELQQATVSAMLLREATEEEERKGG